MNSFEHEKVFFHGSHERLGMLQGRTQMFKKFVEIYVMGAKDVLGADAGKGAFSTDTSRSMAELDPSNPPHKMLQWLPTGSEPAEESVQSIEQTVKNLREPEEEGI